MANWSGCSDHVRRKLRASFQRACIALLTCCWASVSVLDRFQCVSEICESKWPHANMAVSVSHGPFIPLCAAITGRVHFWQPLVFLVALKATAPVFAFSLFLLFYLCFLPTRFRFCKGWGFVSAMNARLTPGNVRFS